MVESTGLQQVLSMSNAAEKVQQTTQQRPDLTHQNMVNAQKVEEEEKSKANPPAEMTREVSNQEQYTDKQGVKYRSRHQKNKNRSSEGEEDAGEARPDTDQGKLVDVRI